MDVLYVRRIINVCDFEVASCTCQIEMWGCGVIFNVGVIVWSVKAFHNHAHSLTVVFK